MNPSVKPQPLPSFPRQTLTHNPPLLPAPPSPDVGYEIDLLGSSLHHHHNHGLTLMDDEDDDPNPLPVGTQSYSRSPFSSLLRDDDEEEEDPDDEDIDPDEALIEDRKPTLSDGSQLPGSSIDESQATAPINSLCIDPAPYVSSQFYTFNQESHALMVRCILAGRLATPDEIRAATPNSVLKSWRSVWKDRNEDTAYLTAWKRIQDKLRADMDGAHPALFFKNNPVHRVSHVEQWQEIVTAAHAGPDLLRHLALKETVERIKQSWTVGARFYGIPESFIRVCVSSCPVCSSSSSLLTSPGGSSLSRSKRRRFEYTESFEVPAKDVQCCLQKLAAKYKVVLCICQKYIRYKPFTAEVKDYACHRAGEPSSASGSAKKARVLKREPYQSKRCGCGFRIRAIVPIMNYNDKDKTFVYQEEGTAIFKLYAIHTGHEPGPLDGNARIVHRLVGNKGAYEFDSDAYSIRKDTEPDFFPGLIGKNETGDPCHAVMQHVQDLKVEVGLLEERIAQMSPDSLGSLAQELSDILHRLKLLGGGMRHSEGPLMVDDDDDIAVWRKESIHHLNKHDGIFSKEAEIIEEEDTNFGSDLGTIAPWNRMTEDCQDRKLLMRENMKPDKWLLKEDCSDFDEKSILHCGVDEESKLKTLTDSSLVVMQVDGFYADSTKWYDSPGGLDPSTDCADGSFRHGRIL